MYWGEDSYYELTEREADAIEAATIELHRRCLDAVAHVVARPLRRARHRAVDRAAGRAQLARARAIAVRPHGSGVRRRRAAAPGGHADTPTSLLEAGVIQWTSLTERFPACDQFNAIHKQLIAIWRALAPRLPAPAYFAAVDDLEDAMTAGYLRDTAGQAGLVTRGILVKDLGWDPAAGALIDLDGAPIAALFKLYPWEGLIADELGALLPVIPVMWLEPAWMMILSNKAILPILWELFPDHPNLLPAASEPLPGAWVRKPRLGREGANVSIRAPGIEVDCAGPYADTGFVYQAYAELGEHNGMRPVISS